MLKLITLMFEEFLTTFRRIFIDYLYYIVQK